ncbi:MAG: hypothetical protein RJA83_121 [Pseudomonadota bacterium]|jgi:hypothetical protein
MPGENNFTEDQFEMNRKRCWEVYESFNKILWIKENVVNRELAYPLEIQGINNDGQAKQAYLRRFNAYIKKINGPRAYAAKYWILPAVFFCMLFQEFFLKEEANLSAPFIITFMLSIFTLKYQTVFTDIPFQYRYIGSFFLNPEDLLLCAASNRMNKANKQASHLMGTFGPLLGFLDKDKTLYKALGSLDIKYQASRYAHEKFWPSCPQNLFASRDLY